jgi:short-subunit dehydrogenase
MARPTALITGASSGIGVEFARLLAASGYDLVLAARSAERLEDVALEIRHQHGGRVETRRCDLASAGGATPLWRGLVADGIAVDTLVNNAGAGLHGPFVEQDADAIDRMVTLNVAALTTLTRLALPPMLDRRVGRILNVASLAAFQPGGPREAVYYATKSFVLTFSKGLARELRGTGVTVTVLCPGPTNTSFQAAAGSTKTMLARWCPMDSPADVARAGWEGTMRGATVVLPGLLTKLLAFGGELPPRGLALEVNRLLLRPSSKS